MDRWSADEGSVINLVVTWDADGDASPPAMKYSTLPCDDIHQNAGNRCGNSNNVGFNAKRATAGDDYTAVSDAAVTWSGNTATIPVTTLTDSVNDADEYFLIKVFLDDSKENPWHVGSNADGTRNSYHFAGYITNDGVLPRQWVAEFAHSTGTQIVDQIKSRLDSRQENGVWTRIARAPIDGSGIAGTNNGGMVGYDEGNEQTTLGVVFTANEAEGSFEDYELDAEIAGVYAYGRHVPTGKASVWGAVGYGRGEIAVTDDSFSDDAALHMQVQGVGVDLTLASTDRVDIGVSTSAVRISAESDDTREFRASKTSSYRYRSDLGFEYRLTDRVRSTASLGYERVGGDVEHSEGETGSVGLVYSDGRLELGIGTTVFEDHEPSVSAAYNGADWQVMVAASGRDDDLTLVGSVAYDVGRNGRGLVLDLAPGHETRIGYGMESGPHEVFRPYLGWSPERTTFGLEYLVGPVLMMVAVFDDMSIMATIGRRW
ncbi:MAG: hypothetical protein OXC14_08635, partial [Rhodospirillaceae bacterium]|nr:hypothetical protein [Rhodospirillaceae bacterium]